MTDNLICVAKITKPHGIRGQAKMMSFTSNPGDVFNYPCLYDDKMNEYVIKLNVQNNNMFIITFNGNKSRNLVEEIAGIKLHITKDMMPETQEDEYYYKDLVDLKVLNNNQELMGRITEIHNFGAGDIIEMELLNDTKTIFLPFEKEFIIEIDLGKKILVFDFIKSAVL